MHMIKEAKNMEIVFVVSAVAVTSGFQLKR
jgi:hypothetical protein